jgi:hypothetical protein
MYTYICVYTAACSTGDGGALGKRAGDFRGGLPVSVWQGALYG